MEKPNILTISESVRTYDIGQGQYGYRDESAHVVLGRYEGRKPKTTKSARGDMLIVDRAVSISASYDDGMRGDREPRISRVNTVNAIDVEDIDLVTGVRNVAERIRNILEVDEEDPWRNESATLRAVMAKALERYGDEST